MNASELFAKSQRHVCSGSFRCHWCHNPCTNLYLHDDPPNLPFHRTTSTAHNPASPYICNGCWLFRRKRTTLYYLDDSWKDGQAIQNHSMWLTEECATILKPSDYIPLYDKLLNPPKLFCLALLTPDPIMSGSLGVKPANTNFVHLMKVNEHQSMVAETKLDFTLNNIPHSYSVYELEQGIKLGPDGREPGVQALLRFLGTPPKAEEKKQEVGRPRNDDSKSHPRRIVKV